MNRIAILSICIFFIYSQALSCPKTEQEAEASLKVSVKCVLEYLQKGWYSTVIKIVESSDDSNNLKEMVRDQISQIRKQLDRVENVLKSDKQIQVITPAFQWAQNGEFIFLDIKFAHRLDAPGCLTIYDNQLDIEWERILFTAKCTISEQPFHLILDLSLYDKVDQAKSSFQHTSVGRLTINLKKQVVDKVWPSVVKGPKPSNMFIWWDL